jgi:chorismate mutase/prephenate dehydratase
VSLTVGAFGKPDSYSCLAAKSVYRSAVLRAIPYAKDVFSELAADKLDIAVLPMENISGGWVENVIYELMKLRESDPAKIIEEIDMPVVLCVAGKKGMSVVGAKRVYSHAYPLLHLGDWLTRTGTRAERIETTSTSQAAEDAANDPESVALCNAAAAKRNGLKILQVPRVEQNITRFISLSKWEKVRRTPERTSLWFDAKDKPGSLADALQIFKRSRINLNRIESRSMDAFKTYRFFVEFEGNAGRPRVKSALETLRRRTLDMAIVGSYPVTRLSPSRVTRIP